VSKHFAEGKILPQAGFACRGLWPPGFPAKPWFCGAGKKKMRSLGSVQLPTEVFLAVLKLDE